MLSIEEILVSPKYSSHFWRLQFTISKTDNRLLLMFCPLFDYVFQEIEAVIRRDCFVLNPLMSKDVTRNMVLRDLIHVLKPIIMRVCVFELNEARMNQQLRGNTSKERFACFVRMLQRKHYTIHLLNKYKKMRDLITQFLSQYVAATVEMFKRLNVDLMEIKAVFFKKHKQVHIQAIERSNGDAHRQRRSVTIIIFTIGKGRKKVVYKPRSLAVDGAFGQFIAWFNTKLNMPLLTPTILTKNGYGWCEFIEHKSCKDEEQVKQFYQREGVLLAIIYLLAGSDIHYENIIAHGEHPMLIDLECLLAPHIAIDDIKTTKIARYFVTQTHFLPKQSLAQEGYRGLDISAFGGQDHQESLYEGLDVVGVGTDTMHYIRKRFTLPQTAHRPVFQNKFIDAIHYCDDFILGFTVGYDIILEHLSELKEKNSPLTVFKNVELRLVIRPTAEYGKLLAESYHPTLLHDPDLFKAHVSWLNNKVQKIPNFASVVAAEIRDLAEGNIPIFVCQGDGHTIYDSYNNELTLKCAQSGYERLTEHLSQLNEKDFIFQKNLIEQSFAAFRLNQNNINKPFQLMLSVRGKTKPKREELKKQALELAKTTLDKILVNSVLSNECVLWSTIEATSDKVWINKFTGISLYSGLSGIALTFSYAAKIFATQEYFACVESCRNTLRMVLENLKNREQYNVGVFSGLAGILYFYHCYYLLFHDESIIAEMQSVLELIHLQINNDKILDIIGGVSGTLVVLLACEELLKQKTVSTCREMCVNRILSFYSQPHQFPEGLKPSLLSKPQIGFAHGIAGMVWALTKYNRQHKRSDVTQWIQNALAYERGFFCPVEKNWPSFLIPMEKNPFAVQWCYGALGIGLGRLDMQKDGWQDEFIEQEIAIATETTLVKGLGSYHNLCHGDLGNLEIIFQHNDANKEQQAWCLIQALLEHMAAGRTQCNECEGVIIPSLMVGHVGLAYQLLRFAHPELVPNVLLLKTPTYKCEQV